MLPYPTAAVEGGAIRGRGSLFHTRTVVKVIPNSGSSTLLTWAASGYAQLGMGKSAISTRAAIAFAIAAFALELVASLMYSAAAGSSSGLSVEPSKLLASGPTGASLIRWGSLIDMFGYLSIAPVIIYLRARYAAARYTDLFAAAGLALVLIGSIGACLDGDRRPAIDH
jgi:hypothetical protein